MVSSKFVGVVSMMLVIATPTTTVTRQDSVRTYRTILVALAEQIPSVVLCVSLFFFGSLFNHFYSNVSCFRFLLLHCEIIITNINGMSENQANYKQTKEQLDIHKERKN